MCKTANTTSSTTSQCSFRCTSARSSSTSTWSEALWTTPSRSTETLNVSFFQKMQHIQQMLGLVTCHWNRHWPHRRPCVRLSVSLWSLHLSVLSAEWRKGEPSLCLSFFSFCWANGSRNALSVCLSLALSLLSLSLLNVTIPLSTRMCKMHQWMQRCRMALAQGS